MECSCSLAELWIHPLALVTLLHKLPYIGIHISPKKATTDFLHRLVPTQMTTCVTEEIILSDWIAIPVLTFNSAVTTFHYTLLFIFRMDAYPPRFVLVRNISSVVEYAFFQHEIVATFSTKVGFVCLGVSSWIFASEQVQLDVLEFFHGSFSALRRLSFNIHSKVSKMSQMS